VINSHYTAGLFEAAHGVRLPVVHPPIDVSGRSYRPDDLPARDTLTFFSRIVDYKRPEWIIDLAARHPELRAVIMGGVAEHRRPYFEHLQQVAIKRGRPDVVFLANPSNERVNAELARTRFYVFPARNEHFGMTTVEAIASGALPFVHDSGGQREIVPQPDLRFSDAEFAAKFDALAALSEPELNARRTALSEHIRQFSEACFLDKMLAYLD
jgi:glycosyltransferase involved in cell wall biosynthesis